MFVFEANSSLPFCREVKKKRRLPKKPITVMPEYKGEDTKGVEVKSDIFEGFTFSASSAL